MIASTGDTKYGLVLSGGGIKFATHAGVVAEIAEWTDQGKSWLDKFSVLVGTSAGALYSAFIVSKYTPAQFVFLSELFSRPELKQALFDWNWDAASAAFLKHQVAYFRGLTSGFGVLSLLETVLSRSVRDELIKIDPAQQSEKAKAEAARLIQARWQERQRRKRDRKYYDELLNFGECTHELFLISVNAYTGQKTVFCKLDDSEEARDQRDEKMFEASGADYINPKEELLGVKDAYKDLKTVVKFKRFDARIHRQFDPDLYGPQLPIALAVRASISMPGFFEPMKIVRKSESPNRKEYDLFLDGAVDDNFSLSVGANPQLGHCTDILGVCLGNLGYRIPDAAAVDGVHAIINKTISSMGDAIVDLQRYDRRLNGRMTIINALTRVEGNLTETQKIAQLVDEGTTIAKDFKQIVCQSNTNTSDPSRLAPSTEIGPMELFGNPGSQRIYLSAAARLGPTSFRKFKTGTNELADPTPSDILGAIPRLISAQSKGFFPRLWLWGYFVVLVLLFGAVTLVLDMLDAVTGVGATLRILFFGAEKSGMGWLLFRVVLAVVIILLLRIWAYWVWVRMRKKA